MLCYLYLALAEFGIKRFALNTSSALEMAANQILCFVEMYCQAFGFESKCFSKKRDRRYHTLRFSLEYCV
jgi:hypothetical protein